MTTEETQTTAPVDESDAKDCYPVRCICSDGKPRTREELANIYVNEFELKSDVLFVLLPFCGDHDEPLVVRKLVDQSLAAACQLWYCDPKKEACLDYTKLREGFHWLKRRGHSTPAGSG